MFYRLSISNQIEISPLFVELKELHLCDENKYDCWLEKARFVKIIKNTLIALNFNF